MNAREYALARLLLTEEKVGSRVRANDRAERERDDASKQLLRQQGLVSDGRAG